MNILDLKFEIDSLKEEIDSLKEEIEGLQQELKVPTISLEGAYEQLRILARQQITNAIDYGDPTYALELKDNPLTVLRTLQFIIGTR